MFFLCANDSISGKAARRHSLTTDLRQLAAGKLFHIRFLIISNLLSLHHRYLCFLNCVHKNTRNLNLLRRKVQENYVKKAGGLHLPAGKALNLRNTKGYGLPGSNFPDCVQNDRCR